jgi:hypothetical protein
MSVAAVEAAHPVPAARAGEPAACDGLTVRQPPTHPEHGVAGACESGPTGSTEGYAVAPVNRAGSGFRGWAPGPLANVAANECAVNNAADVLRGRLEEGRRGRRRGRRQEHDESDEQDAIHAVERYADDVSRPVHGRRRRARGRPRRRGVGWCCACGRHPPPGRGLVRPTERLPRSALKAGCWPGDVAGNAGGLQVASCLRPT